VNKKTASRLLDLNRRFYQTFAVQFSSTRQRLQPGVMRILDEISSQANILDLGCGNGELAKELSSRGYQGSYLGMDSNAEFLILARRKLPDETSFQLIERDLTEPDWDQELPITSFDVILAFSVLHHIPGTQLRLQLLEKIHHQLLPEGSFFHSEWQFLNSPRLRERIQPWDSVDIKSDQVDQGDYLLDWRQGGQGFRYVHHFESDELEKLAHDAGFRILQSFTSDGEGGKLGLYQKWKRV
jgi:SAM-dependent methyltransferase